MHEFHAWITLRDSTVEEDKREIARVVEELKSAIASANWPTARYQVQTFNGLFFLNADGFSNRRRYEAEFLDDLLHLVCQKLPGSYGLIYEGDDERQVPPGGNSFLVRVMARGKLTDQNDPFLSPINPIIEDPFE
jgi:hypothetical protein